MSGGGDLGRLRWRCRRGMRELDVLFTRYLDRSWAAASDGERRLFLQLLDGEDDRLWRWFMGYEAVADVELDALVRRIRELP
ncbi:succinate dehydrogenase assembly factor 2 [Luteimonas sp. SJ-92]|uniref:FAD assembly factor SdhE n=1 Tax=Luteimonas salinisoli TaxID=2752307 RepID=A0A853JCM3_9GAMM|nr:succinate dehydrogenase assembly factor 2 [Luteimonas salinisoli]NZA27023.1 succinate dehydrogenase assembly factor 2 [Luteimonas salinisoli]